MNKTICYPLFPPSAQTNTNERNNNEIHLGVNRYISWVGMSLGKKFLGIDRGTLTLRGHTSGTCMIDIGGLSPPDIMGLKNPPNFPFGHMIHFDDKS